MTDLEDAFGSDFVQTFKQERQKRQAERERIEDDEMKKIAALAVNEGKMNGKNPMFTYTSETGVTHDVLLVTVPDPDNRSYWSLKTEGNESSVSLPVDYLGQWIWAWFNDRDMAKKLEPGDEFIIAGRLDSWERDDGTEQDTISPVRGLSHIRQIKQWADEVLEEDGFEAPEQPEDEDPAVLEATQQEAEESQESSQELEPESSTESDIEPESEPEPQQTPNAEHELDQSATSADSEEESSDDSDTAGKFSQMLEDRRQELVEESDESEEDEELVPFEDVKEEIEDIGSEEPRVWELSEEEPGLLDKLVNMVGNRLDYDTNEEGAVQDKNIAAAIREHALKVIEENNEEEESETDNLF